MKYRCEISRRRLFWSTEDFFMVCEEFEAEVGCWMIQMKKQAYQEIWNFQNNLNWLGTVLYFKQIFSIWKVRYKVDGEYLRFPEIFYSFLNHGLER